MRDIDLRRLFLYLLIGSVAVSALIGIVVVLLGSFGTFEVRVLMTTLTVTVTSILGLACGAYYETGRGRMLPLAGIVLTVIAAMMALLIIWDVLDDSQIFIKSSITVLVGAVACSHLSLLSIARLDRRFSWVRVAAYALITTLAGVLVLIIWTEPDSYGDLIARVLGVLSILVGAVTVITPVFHKLSHVRDEHGPEAIDAEIARLKQRIDELEAERSGLAESRV